jgi:hypothetical protein
MVICEDFILASMFGWASCIFILVFQLFYSFIEHWRRRCVLAIFWIMEDCGGLDLDSHSFNVSIIRSYISRNTTLT